MMEVSMNAAKRTLDENERARIDAQYEFHNVYRVKIEKEARAWEYREREQDDEL